MAAKKMHLLTLDQAIQEINRHWGLTDRSLYSKQTLYKAIHKGELHRYGPRHVVFVDRDEIMARYCK